MTISSRTSRILEFFLPFAAFLLMAGCLLYPLLQRDSLSIHARQAKMGVFQVFYDVGSGYSESDSIRLNPNPLSHRIQANPPLPLKRLGGLRIDPSNNDGSTQIWKIALKSRGNWLGKKIDLSSIVQTHGIESKTLVDGVLTVFPEAGQVDPFFVITPIEYSPPSKHALLIKSALALLLPALLIAASWFFARKFWQMTAKWLISTGSRVNRYFISHSHFEKQPLPQYRANHHLVLIALLVAFLIVSRLINLPLIGSYGDDSHKWLHGKMLVGEIPLSEWQWDHHTARLSIMAATWIVQAVFGTEPGWYYLAPFVANLLLVITLYFIGSRLIHPIAGFGAAAWTILWSPFEYYQLMPSPFVALFLAASIWVLFRTLNAKKHVLIWVALCAVLAFWGYLSWVGALFFLPPFAWFLLREKGWRAALLFCAILLVGYLAETFLYRVFAEIPLGRIGIIMANHMDSVNYQMEWMDLFRRYEFLPPLYKKVILGFFCIVPALLLLFKRLPKAFRQYLFIPVCFFFLLTFCIKSVDPLSVVLQHHQPRYAYPALPFVFLTFCATAMLILSWMLRWSLFKPLRNPWVHVSIIFIWTAWTLNATYQLRDPNRSFTSRLQQLDSYDQLCALADVRELAFIEMDNPYSKGIKFYLDILQPRTSQTPTRTEHWFRIGERYGRVLLPHDPLEHPQEGNLRDHYTNNLCLFLYQMPFRLSFGTVDGLSNDRFPIVVNAYVDALGMQVPWELRSQTDPNQLRPARVQAHGANHFSVHLNDAPNQAALLRIPLRPKTLTKDKLCKIVDVEGKTLFEMGSVPPGINQWVYLDVPLETAAQGEIQLFLDAQQCEVGEFAWVVGY
jgi:hypothetical protein